MSDTLPISYIYISAEDVCAVIYITSRGDVLAIGRWVMAVPR